MTRTDGKSLNQNSYIRRDWLRSVCFTETPIDHVSLQMETILGRKLHFEPYGLAFRESTVRARNGNPVIYIQTTNRPIRDAFDDLSTNPLATTFKMMIPLIEGFGPPWFQGHFSPREIDFRWEREWRIVGDFSFSISDVAFGFCPDNETTYFENLVGGAFPFIDPTGNIPSAKQKLRSNPQLVDIK